MPANDPQAGDSYHRGEDEAAIVVARDGDMLWMRGADNTQKLVTLQQLASAGWVWGEPIDVRDLYNVQPATGGINLTVNGDRIFLTKRDALLLALHIVRVLDSQAVFIRRMLKHWLG